jgi:hypothetical protein
MIKTEEIAKPIRKTVETPTAKPDSHRSHEKRVESEKRGQTGSG